VVNVGEAIADMLKRFPMHSESPAPNAAAPVCSTGVSQSASDSSTMDNADNHAPDAAPTDGSVATDDVNLELVIFLYKK
jgi:hypothetical protein